jgi:hypothetical protein
MTLNKVQAAFLKSLADASGHVEPERVVEAAKEPDNCLHDLFDWNVNNAATQHWLTQAGQIIRLVKFEFKVVRRTYAVPFYLNNPASKAKSRHFIKTELVKEDFAKRRAQLLIEISRIKAAIRRAQILAIYFEMSEEFGGMLDDLIQLEQAAQAAGPPPPPPKGGPRSKQTGRRPTARRRSAKPGSTATPRKARRRSSN